MIEECGVNIRRGRVGVIEEAGSVLTPHVYKSRWMPKSANRVFDATLGWYDIHLAKLLGCRSEFSKQSIED